MKHMFIMLLLMVVSVIAADPTHYIGGRWYSCDQYDYDAKGNKIHFKNSDGVEWWSEYDAKGHEIHSKSSDGVETWSKWFGSKKRGKMLRCEVDKYGNPI